MDLCSCGRSDRRVRVLSRSGEPAQCWRRRVLPTGASRTIGVGQSHGWSQKIAKTRNDVATPNGSAATRRNRSQRQESVTSAATRRASIHRLRYIMRRTIRADFCHRRGHGQSGRAASQRQRATFLPFLVDRTRAHQLAGDATDHWRRREAVGSETARLPGNRAAPWVRRCSGSRRRTRGRSRGRTTPTGWSRNTDPAPRWSG
jgi:hypothetical protein